MAIKSSWCSPRGEQAKRGYGLDAGRPQHRPRGRRPVFREWPAKTSRALVPETSSDTHATLFRLIPRSSGQIGLERALQ
jgi:hypothetical protein